jgi:hypothetical protein
MMEILIYGLAKGEKRDYMEELLSTNCKNDNDIEKVIKHAKGFGYHSFRIANYNGEAPDFVATINSFPLLSKRI